MKMTFSSLPVALALMLVGLAGCGGGAEDNDTQAAAVAPPRAGHPPPLDRPTVHSSTVPLSSATATSAEESSLREQVAQLRREVAAIRLQVARMPQGSAHVDTDRDPALEAAARVADEQALAADTQSRESRFRIEVIDVAWSRSTTESLRRALVTDGAEGNPHIQSIECRSQSCRVVVDLAAAEASGKDLPVAFAHLSQSLPNVSTGRIDLGLGHEMTVVYLTR